MQDISQSRDGNSQIQQRIKKLSVEEQFEDIDEEEIQYQNIAVTTYKQEAHQYWIGNPMNLIISGTLFTILPKQVDFSTEKCNSQEVKNGDHSQLEQEIKSFCCILIPNSKPPVEACESFKNYFREIIEFRVMRTSVSNYYSILFFVKFGTEKKKIEQKILQINSYIQFIDNNKSQEDFIKSYQQQKFNQIEMHKCLLTEIKACTINIQNFDQSIIEKKNLPQFRQQMSSNSDGVSLVLQIPTIVSPHELSIRFPKANQTTGLTQEHETSNCAICFESLTDLRESESPLKKNQNFDQQLGDPIISILCGHYFHLNCLSQWQDNTCPLCRFHQQPPDVQYCESCSSSENLWICLVCGAISCGFEVCEDNHMRLHFEQSGHAYAMEIETQIVFDNISNSYIHRLLQNQVDGKLIPMDNPDIQPGTYIGSDQGANRINSMSSEYSTGGQDQLKIHQYAKQYEMIMAKELETQRKFFQNQLSEIARKQKTTISKLKDQENELFELCQQIDQQLETEKQEYQFQENQLLKAKSLFSQLASRQMELEKNTNDLSQKLDQVQFSQSDIEKSQINKLKQIKEDILSINVQIQDIQLHIKNKEKIEKQLKDHKYDVQSSFVLIEPSKGAAQKQKQKK